MGLKGNPFPNRIHENASERLELGCKAAHIYIEIATANGMSSGKKYPNKPY
jgi:hypothetical protein